MGRIVVAGALANKPRNGGAAWTRLSWALGFRRLGHEVYFIEQIAPSTCVDQRGTPCAIDDSVNLAYFRLVTERFQLNAALIVEGGTRTFGMTWDELLVVSQTADLLVDISGHLTIETLKYRFGKRIFIDLDPGYTQFWHADGLAEDRLRDHHYYFSVGENIGQPFCRIPTANVDWRPIRQPVVLDEWPVVSVPASALRFTTVASWRGPLGRVTHRDLTFGVKAHEFRKFVALPTRCDHAFEMALEIDAADQQDLALLRASGWTVVDPDDVAGDPLMFRQFVQQSGAEFSVAQGIYVETQSGWFSDRTVRYLASGKPALVQDTGWARNYPTGRGLLSFRTLEEAVDGVNRIASDYTGHSRAARDIAETFFDARIVLPALIAEIDGRPVDAATDAALRGRPVRG
jgi:hypothetical protein